MCIYYKNIPIRATKTKLGVTIDVNGFVKCVYGDPNTNEFKQQIHAVLSKIKSVIDNTIGV